MVTGTNGVTTETWTDESSGGGDSFLGNVKALNISKTHTNSTNFGGGQSLIIGSFNVDVSTNAAPVIGAVCDGAGKIIGYAIAVPAGTAAASTTIQSVGKMLAPKTKLFHKFNISTLILSLNRA